jgi:hypothetical protein
MASIRDAVLQVGALLDSMEITYAIGGLSASSVHGVARPTQDLDLIAAIPPAQADAFVDALRRDFYVDAESIRSAIRLRRSFNLIHLETGFKIDIFPVGSHALGSQQLKRRRIEESAIPGGPAATFPVISPEDTILVKLSWYRDGGESSERQWNDLRNIIRVQGDRLDQGYLHEWSRELGVSDLLGRLLNESSDLIL